MRQLQRFWEVVAKVELVVKKRKKMELSFWAWRQRSGKSLVVFVCPWRFAVMTSESVSDRWFYLGIS